VSLNLTVPLGKKRLQNEQGIAQARIAIKNDEIKIAQLKVSLANQIDDGMERIKEDRLNISMSEQAVSLQDKTLEITRKKIKYGMSTNFELFSQQTTYFQLVQSLLQNRIQYLNDLASFDALLGTTLDTWHIDVRY
jgi:outer membrane protein TolC